MKALKVPGGIIHIGESKADCPYCTRHIEIEEADTALQRSKNGFAKINCKGCKRKVGVTSDMMGDIRSFEL